MGESGVAEPGALVRARLVVNLCDRFKCLPEPGGLLDQDAELIQMLRIIELGTPRIEGGGGHGEYGYDSDYLG
jgi:hypothetical protein